MKLNKYILLLATAFLFNSCADFLDRDPLSQASENTFGKQKQMQKKV